MAVRFEPKIGVAQIAAKLGKGPGWRSGGGAAPRVHLKSRGLALALDGLEQQPVMGAGANGNISDQS
ncbi:MAG TPA: hypothetical protein EYG54_09015, partial [Myxococcales bacterium]|nr:hypothetical protein [Myxococcales bacterium]